MIWREKRVLLTVLAVLLAANTLFFFTYRVQYQNRLTALDTRLDEVKTQLDDARRARIAAEQQIATYRQSQQDVRHIYETRWATQEERLAALISEVMRLSAVADLVPPAWQFQRTETKSAGRTAGIGATEVGISFTVEGTYQKVRRLINLLEVSEQFIIIDRLSLNSQNGQTLTMTLLVKTLFRESPSEGRAANQNL